MLGKIEGRRRRIHRDWKGWMASPAQWVWVWASSGSWWWTVKPGVLQSMGLQSWTRLSTWTEQTESQSPNLPSTLTAHTSDFYICVSSRMLFHVNLPAPVSPLRPDNYPPVPVWEISSFEQRTCLCHLLGTTRLEFWQVSVICFPTRPVTINPLLKSIRFHF